MKYLLDTCVVSELVRPKASAKVVRWVKRQEESTLFLSVLTLGELHKGVEKLSDSKRKRILHFWWANDLKERFENRILDIDKQVAVIWGEIQAKSEKAGRPMPAIDALIAATGIAHRLTVVTRNGTDMKESGIELYNPWE